MKQISSSELER